MKLFLCACAALVLVACSGSDGDDTGGTSSSGGGGASSGGGGTNVTGPTKDYVSLDADKFCGFLNCPGASATTSQTECVANFKATRVTADCKSKLDAATCDSPASILTDCFPACTGDAQTCDGSHITTCGGGKTYVFECDGICATQNKKWVGACGKTYQNQNATEDKCWCL